MDKPARIWPVALGVAGIALFVLFTGTWMLFWKSDTRQRWVLIGQLPGNPHVDAVVASPAGYGVIGVKHEPQQGELAARMRARRAQILRATADGLEVVYEGSGWIAALDTKGKVWFAIGATL